MHLGRRGTCAVVLFTHDTITALGRGNGPDDDRSGGQHQRIYVTYMSCILQMFSNSPPFPFPENYPRNFKQSGRDISLRKARAKTSLRTWLFCRI